MHNSIYQSCEGVTDSDILTIQENIRSRQETIRKEILIVVEKKRYLNRLLPICRLSGKALSHICSYLTHDRTPPPFLRTRYPCITMSHVCHSWRETVLQIPELWSTFCLGSPHCVALHLERSGDALLQVSTTRPSIIANFDNLYAKPQFSTFATDALKLVLRQSHRVRSLTLDVSKRALEDAFDHFYKDVGAEHKSALQSIILITKGSCELPNILSVPHLSALTCIELRGYQMVWHPSLLQFTTLNRIIIRNSRTHDSCSCGIHGLLHVLRNNPRVRVLEFVDASRDSTCSDSIDTPGEELLLISLRSLETLKIHSDAACINFFLTQCAIPTWTITDLKACDIIRSSPSAADFRKTIHTLRSVMSHIAKKSSLMNGLQLTFHYLLEAENANITIRRPPNGIVFQTYHYNPSCERTPSTTHREQLVERDQFHFHYPSLLTTGFSDTLRDLLLVLPLSRCYLHQDRDHYRAP
ncbi:hypothetical protein QCA50_006195 [Cerrena zonata]|uniref:F-box domain-containing protein n=1 Tax=Cerrena zonata TaxID=2478898 RepID=A0AAW0GME8_9APHY